MLDFISDRLCPLKEEERDYFLEHVPNVVVLGCERLLTILRKLRLSIKKMNFTERERASIINTIKLRSTQVESIRSLTRVYDARVALNLNHLIEGLEYDMQVEGRGTLWFGIDSATCALFRLVLSIESLRHRDRLTRKERRRIGRDIAELYRSVSWAEMPREVERELLRSALRAE